MTRRLTALISGVFILGWPATGMADPYQPARDHLVMSSANGLSLHAPDLSANHDISFGAAFHSTMRLLVAVLGPEYRVSLPEECPAGPLIIADFQGGISVTFLEDRMVGWMLNPGSPLRTSGGIGLGTPVSYFNVYGDPEIANTSLGIEFSASRLSGLLSAPDGEVTALWAGTNCIIR